MLMIYRDKSDQPKTNSTYQCVKYSNIGVGINIDLNKMGYFKMFQIGINIAGASDEYLIDYDNKYIAICGTYDLIFEQLDNKSKCSVTIANFVSNLPFFKWCYLPGSENNILTRSLLYLESRELYVKIKQVIESFADIVNYCMMVYYHYLGVDLANIVII